MNEVIGRILDLVSDLHDLASGKEKLLITIDGTVALVSFPFHRDFMSAFETYDIENFDSKNFPYVLVNDVEGIVFRSLITERQYQEIIKKTA